MARTLIYNATIISVDPKVGDLHRGDILIDGTKIAAIAPTIAAGDAEIVDHALDAGPVVPGTVEQHEFAARGQLRDVALEEPLRALALGRLLQRTTCCVRWILCAP